MDNIKELSKPVGFVGLRNIISLAEGSLGVISPNAAFGEEPVYSQEYVNSLIGQVEAAKKERDDLLNQEFQQRLANAEHQLYMKDLAIHNIKASRKAQFRKRLAAETALSAANEKLKGGQVPVFEVEMSCGHWINMGPISGADLSKLPDGINKLFTAAKPLIGIRELVESEIGDFCAGLSQPGEPASPEEMQRQLLQRIIPLLLSAKPECE